MIHHKTGPTRLYQGPTPPFPGPEPGRIVNKTVELTRLRAYRQMPI